MDDLNLFHKEFLPLLKNKWVIISFLICTIIIIFIGIERTSSAHFGSDFHMYYTSGQHFSSDVYLYKNPDSGAPYVYPPFAAFLFQGFNLVSEGVAVGIGFIINFLITLVNAALIYAIIRKTGYEKKSAGIAVGLALLFSITEIWNNINFSQINPFIFCLTLSGIYSFLCGKIKTALVFLSMGAWIKVLPVFFIFWILLRKFSWKAVATVALVSVFCIGITFLQRGWEQGIQDHIGYYEDFLKGNMVDGVNTIWRNQSLSAALTRAFVPEENAENLNYSWVNLGAGTSAVLVKGMGLGIFLLAYFLSFRKKREKAPVSIFEISLIYLMTHLFSGVTWKGHLLTSFLFFAPIFLINWKEYKLPGKLFHFLLFIPMIVWIIPKSVFPKEIYLYINGWSFWTWTLLLLFGYYSFQLVSESRDLRQTEKNNG